MSSATKYVNLNKDPKNRPELEEFVRYAWKRQNSIPRSVNPSHQENFSGPYSSVAQTNDRVWILDGGHGGTNTWESYVPKDIIIILMGGGAELNTIEAPLSDRYELESTVRTVMDNTDEMTFYVDGEKIEVVVNRKKQFDWPDNDPYYFKTGLYPAFTVPDDPTLASTSMYGNPQVAIYYAEIWALAVNFNGEGSDHTLRARHSGSGYRLDTEWKIHLVDLNKQLGQFEEDKKKYDEKYSKK
jgi:hypothetical protein